MQLYIYTVSAQQRAGYIRRHTGHRLRSCTALCSPMTRTWCTITLHFLWKSGNNFTKQKPKQHCAQTRWGMWISTLCLSNMMPLCPFTNFLNYKWMYTHRAYMTKSIKEFFLYSWILPSLVQRGFGKSKAGMHRTAGIIQGFINIHCTNRHDTAPNPTLFDYPTVSFRHTMDLTALKCPKSGWLALKLTKSRCCLSTLLWTTKGYRREIFVHTHTCVCAY